MTAAHLLPAFQEVRGEMKKPEIMRRRLSLSIDDNRLGLVKFVQSKGKFQEIFCPVLRLHMFVEHDIALLWIDESNDPRPRRPFLAIVENPEVGTNVSIIGYPGSHNELGPKLVADVPRIFLGALVQSEGQLVELKPDGRDAGHASFPCIETTCVMGAGHSGGPALDRTRNAIVGVNSISGSDQSSLISWPGKVLDQKLTLKGISARSSDGQLIDLGDTSLRELASHKMIVIL